VSHLRYLSYLLRHKWFVFVAGLRIGGIPLWHLIVHDWSKFLPCEWFPYVAYFYGKLPSWDEAKIQCPGYSYCATKEAAAQRFDVAWLHHQHTNPHHWQHWILREDSGATKLLEMPDHFLREMVADWMGAGRVITGRWEAAKWYGRNQELIQLHSDVRKKVESLLS
jgi:Family of unknown function (DUF5662)